MIEIPKRRRRPSSQEAVTVRVAAFAVAALSMIVVPVTLIRLASGHGSIAHSGLAIVVALAATAAMTVAAKRVDPLRR